MWKLVIIMITANDYGLPEPKELEQWALPYFPEFQETSDAKAGYSPVVEPSYEGVPSGVAGFDVNRIRLDFPILKEKVSGGKTLVWLDNGATTQKPQAVIDRISYYYEHENSN